MPFGKLQMVMASARLRLRANRAHIFSWLIRQSAPPDAAFFNGAERRFGLVAPTPEWMPSSLLTREAPLSYPRGFSAVLAVPVLIFIHQGSAIAGVRRGKFAARSVVSRELAAAIALVVK